MKKNGFTLIEIMAVIVLLGLLIAIISPAVTGLIKDSEDTLEEQQINNIVNATKKYMVEHSDLLPDEGLICMDINDLVSNGVIENDSIINPKTKEEITGYVVVSYNAEFNQYEYYYSSEYVENVVEPDYSFNHIYFSYGERFENLSTSNSWQSKEAQFIDDAIYLSTSGYEIVYTDQVDLSLYKAVIIKKTNLVSGRARFAQYPERVNNEGEWIELNWVSLGNDYYIADISEQTRNDMHFYINAWGGGNSGYIYYISFSEKSVEEVMEDTSFLQ